ncbi:MAG: twin-arginine translocation signal domain-containing protein, partial [Planctomycetaceae bacterium]|nr:twin-arginine translocation signal domain-containing protein [Planctomycetaceae bacterium]
MLTNRRQFLQTTAAAVTMATNATFLSAPSLFATTEKQQIPVQAFCVDFNWDYKT